jgi:LysR family glycine cleavage system transcriptional activator
LASDALVGDDLAAGRLVKPLGFTLQEDIGYYVVHARSQIKNQHVRWMTEWLLSHRAMGSSGSPQTK